MKDITEMTFEEFCEGMEKVLAPFGVKITENIVNELLVHVYNKYRSLVAEGMTMEQLEPFFRDVVKKISEAVKGDESV